MVDIDDASLARLGQWPWPRAMLATLTERLTELGAASIGFDVLFPEPDRLGAANDSAFAAALGRTGSVLGFSVSPKAPRLTLPPKTSDRGVRRRSGARRCRRSAAPSRPCRSWPKRPPALAGLSLNAEDSAGIVRRVPLLWSDGTALYPGLSIETLRLALGIQTLVALGDTVGGHTLEGIASARSPCPPPPAARSCSTTSRPIRRRCCRPGRCSTTATDRCARR